MALYYHLLVYALITHATSNCLWIVNGGQCSRECDGGERRRVVVCLSADTLDVVSDSLCNVTARPTDLERCNMQPCGSGIRYLAVLSSDYYKYVRQQLSRRQMTHCAMLA